MLINRLPFARMRAQRHSQAQASVRSSWACPDDAPLTIVCLHGVPARSRRCSWRAAGSAQEPWQSFGRFRPPVHRWSVHRRPHSSVSSAASAATTYLRGDEKLGADDGARGVDDEAFGGGWAFDPWKFALVGLLATANAKQSRQGLLRRQATGWRGHRRSVGIALALGRLRRGWCAAARHQLAEIAVANLGAAGDDLRSTHPVCPSVLRLVVVEALGPRPYAWAWRQMRRRSRLGGCGGAAPVEAVVLHMVAVDEFTKVFVAHLDQAVARDCRSALTVCARIRRAVIEEAFWPGAADGVSRRTELPYRPLHAGRVRGRWTPKLRVASAW